MIERVGERYLIRRILGRGGMGEVYEAQDLRLGRTVALKVLTDGGSTTGTERLLREARAASAFEHANAVMVFDVGTEGDIAYLAMELVRGRPLRELIGDATIPMAERVRWLTDVARALDAAHHVSLLHRDVKPENLMVREDGKIKVLDFGIARSHTAGADPTGRTQLQEATGLGTLTAAGAFVGTLAYAAPEQLSGDGLDGRTDQFAWGVTAYELCTGKRPWEGSPATLLSRILTATPVPPSQLEPGIPPQVEAAILRALAKRPADRFPTMAELAATLEPHSSGSLVPATSSPTPASAPGAAGRKPRWAALGLAAGAALALGVAFQLGKPAGAKRANAGPAHITAVKCSNALLEGTPTPDVAEPLGVGACARLALELGVEWTRAGSGSPLDVVAKLQPNTNVVELRIAGVKASGQGATPLDAVDAAVSALSRQLTPPTFSPAESAAWGAKDAVGARVVARAWQRLSLRLVARPEVEARDLVRSHPESAFAHVLHANSLNPGSEEHDEAIKAGLTRAEALPSARRAAVRGHLLSFRSPRDWTEAAREARAAFNSGSDDPEVVALVAIALVHVGHDEEGLALIERAVLTIPTHSLRALRFALSDMRDRARDIERDRKLIQHMTGIFPESRGWPQVIDALAIHGLLDEARADLDFSERLGLTRAQSNTLSRGRLHLAALDPVAARRAAAPLLADPGPFTQASGAWLTIASYWLEGRALEAQKAQRTEIERRFGAADAATAMNHANTDLQIRRWLGEPPPQSAQLAQLAAALPTLHGLPEAFLIAMRSEMALAHWRSQSGARARRQAQEVLTALERAAEDQRDDRVYRNGLLVESLPLTRALRGDQAGAERWRQTDRAPPSVRRFVAFDAALTLEATGDLAGAEAAYLTAKDSMYAEYASFDFIAAHIRLASLYRRLHRPDEATRLEVIIDRLWTKADPGFREAVLRIR